MKLSSVQLVIKIIGNHERGSIKSADSFIHFNNMIRNSDLLEFPAKENKLSW